MIDLYATPGPEAWKVSIALEALGIPYVVHAPVAGAHETPEAHFMRPGAPDRLAIVDRDADGCTVYEAGAILVYLAGKTGRLMPPDAIGRTRVLQWLLLDVSGIDPSSGRDSVVRRGELRRLFALLERSLQGGDHLAGDFSIADIAHWAWVRLHAWSAIDMAAYPALAGWTQRLGARDDFRRGIALPAAVEEAPPLPVCRVRSILLR